MLLALEEFRMIVTTMMTATVHMLRVQPFHSLSRTWRVYTLKKDAFIVKLFLSQKCVFEAVLLLLIESDTQLSPRNTFAIVIVLGCAQEPHKPNLEHAHRTGIFGILLNSLRSVLEPLMRYGSLL